MTEQEIGERNTEKTLPLRGRTNEIHKMTQRRVKLVERKMRVGKMTWNKIRIESKMTNKKIRLGRIMTEKRIEREECRREKDREKNRL